LKITPQCTDPNRSLSFGDGDVILTFHRNESSKTSKLNPIPDLNPDPNPKGDPPTCGFLQHGPSPNWDTKGEMKRKEGKRNEGKEKETKGNETK
jgi:hypothetical protein